MSSAMTTLADLAFDIKQRRNGQHCGRYAPSPTGPLHMGNLRTALLAWLQARLTDSIFVLRIEDLDKPRVKAGSTEQIIHDLKWLGIDWDEGPDSGGLAPSYKQSQRDEIYKIALQALDEQGLTFQCACSRKDIAQLASAPHTGYGLGVYPGTCRNTKNKTPKPGKPTGIRFIVDGIETTFEDKLLRQQSQNLVQEVGDFVLKRADGMFAYQLAVAVDDALMGVSDVVRGADLLDSTHRQIALLEALSLPVPGYWHVPLMLDEEGRRLSKRDGDESLDVWRKKDAKPEQVIGYLANSLAWMEANQSLSLQELLQAITMEQLKTLV